MAAPATPSSVTAPAPGNTLPAVTTRSVIWIPFRLGGGYVCATQRLDGEVDLPADFVRRNDVVDRVPDRVLCVRCDAFDRIDDAIGRQQRARRRRDFVKADGEGHLLTGNLLRACECLGAFCRRHEGENLVAEVCPGLD